MVKNVVVIVVVLVLGLAGMARADTITVGPGASYDFNTIQAGINAANDGDTVIVAPGTYTGPGNRDIDFLGKAITVRSTDPNDPNIVAATIIDCNGTEDEPHRGFYFHNSEDANSILDGLTIRNGYARGYSGWPSNCGGAILCERSSPVIRNCTIIGNFARYAGGGIYASQSTLVVDNSHIEGNVTRHSGGGIAFWKTTAVISKCSILGNTTGIWGGGIQCTQSNLSIISSTITGNSSLDGGGISSETCSLAITGCIFTRNFAERNGGGISNFGGDLRLTRSIFSGNSSLYQGGGIENTNSYLKLTNCIFSGNSAQTRGGGIYDRSVITVPPDISSGSSQGIPVYRIRTYGQSSDRRLTKDRFTTNQVSVSAGPSNSKIQQSFANCTFTGNLAEQGGAIHCRATSRALSNCIIWDNTATKGGAIYLSSTWSKPAWITVSYTDLERGSAEIFIEPNCTLDWTTGNIDDDPYFVEPGYWDANDTLDDVSDDFWVEGNYHLLPISLCIDAGDPNYLPEPNETDLDGNPRIIGDAIDMGAFETNYVESAMKFTPQTLNCDGKGKWVKAHFVLPEGFSPQDVNINEPAVAYPMDTESEYIKVLGSNKGLVRLEVVFDHEAFCDSITDEGPLDITVIGSLTTGQCFYGTDSVRIIDRKNDDD